MIFSVFLSTVQKVMMPGTELYTTSEKNTRRLQINVCLKIIL